MLRGPQLRSGFTNLFVSLFHGVLHNLNDVIQFAGKLVVICLGKTLRSPKYEFVEFSHSYKLADMIFPLLSASLTDYSCFI